MRLKTGGPRVRTTSTERGIWAFTESIEVVVGSIIVDLLVRDAGVASGREGLRAVGGKEGGQYLEEIYVACEENEAGWGSGWVTRGSAWLDLTYRTSHSRKKNRKTDSD